MVAIRAIWASGLTQSCKQLVSTWMPSSRPSFAKLVTLLGSFAAVPLQNARFEFFRNFMVAIRAIWASGLTQSCKQLVSTWMPSSRPSFAKLVTLLGGFAAVP